MPADLKERMLKSINFQTAYSLGENLAATCLRPGLARADTRRDSFSIHGRCLREGSPQQCRSAQFSDILLATLPPISTTYGVVVMQQATTAISGQRCSL